MYIDPIYWYFALPGLLLSFLAQMYVTYTYNRYAKRTSGRGRTGLESAQMILDGEDFPIQIATTQGKLNDHFDPGRNIVNISSDNLSSQSIANIAVVAHEFGHVQQKYSRSILFRIRQTMVPITQIGTQIGYVLFFIGLALSFLKLSELGLIFFSTSVLFSLITIPIELDASNRAMLLINKYDLIEPSSRSGARSVLNAAAMTYFAGLLSSILNLLYYVNVLNRRRS